MSETCDLIVIGAGQAGPSIAVRFAEAGFRVALIERDRLGGTCVNDGCIPTKTLVASARAAHVARRAGDFGVICEPVTVDLAAVKRRKDLVVQQSRVSLAHWIAGSPGVELIMGEARFVAPRTVAVGTRILTAPLVVINAGGRPVRPVWPGLDDADILTNREMMDLDVLPQRLIVIGGSYIGIEFAQMYRRFGSDVVVLESADRLIPREDADVSAAIQILLESEGIAVHLGVKDISGAKSTAGFDLRFSAGGRNETVGGSHLLAAVGRRPNVDSLNLDAAGIRLDHRGFIDVDDRLRTSVEGVYAVGDVNGRSAFTHASYNDFEILTDNLLDGGQRSLHERTIGYALYTDPPLARVGLTEREARALGRPVLRAELPMTRVGRARERGETVGFMRVLVDPETERVLGATLFGIEADEIVHLFILAMTAGLSYRSLMQAVPVHPTVSELIPTMLTHLAPLLGEGA